MEVFGGQGTPAAAAVRRGLALARAGAVRVLLSARAHTQPRSPSKNATHATRATQNTGPRDAAARDGRVV